VEVEVEVAPPAEVVAALAAPAPVVASSLLSPLLSLEVDALVDHLKEAAKQPWLHESDPGKCWWVLLKLSCSATTPPARDTAYKVARRLLRLVHPDRCDHPGATEATTTINSQIKPSIDELAYFPWANWPNSPPL
jgi:hypothetical protein